MALEPGAVPHAVAAAREMEAGETDGDFGDWDSRMDEPPVASLLDASRLCRDADAAWEELRDATGWDFAAFRAGRRLGDYDCVRLVNALRTAQLSADGGPSPAATVARLRGLVTGPLLEPASTLWTDDAWLRPPMGPDDGLVTAVLAGGGDEDDDAVGESGAASAPPAAGGAAAAPPPAGPAVDDMTLAEARAAIAALRATLARLVADGGSDSDEGESDDDEEGDDGAAGAGAGGSREGARRAVVRVGAPYRRAAPGAAELVPSAAAAANVSASGRDVDSYYFESYAHSGIHADMLRDAPRTLGYRDCITACAPWFAGGTVMDVGCGTGILSMFAARAGARRVWALDASSIADAATAIVQRNGLAGSVQVVRGKVEEVRLPGEAGESAGEGEGDKRVDVIVSEWMGYALLYESMLAR